MVFINRKVPIRDVANKLGLSFGGNGHIHCWFPERHKNSDRTASVGVQASFNSVKCFGCNNRPLGPLDLVMSVLGLTAGEAALWVAQRFSVPQLPKGKHLERKSERRIAQYGTEKPLELLVISGIWAKLNAQTQRLLPALLSLAKKRSENPVYDLELSYAGLQRYTGIASLSSVSKALQEAQAIGWLQRPEKRNYGPGQPALCYILTPFSDEVLELANSIAAERRQEIEAEKKLRRAKRSQRISQWQERTGAANVVITKYNSLYAGCSNHQFPATPSVAAILHSGCCGPPFSHPMLANL
ncbi:MAG: hypothetical protein M3N41_14175 [Acidobacteriota bacterium]|nr:hypothetical protein [Acidobacteriota bacterium]